MEQIFLKLFNMSITAGWLVLAIVLLRLILKKAPRAIICLLWGLVGIRLLVPFSFESVLSLIPSAETVPPDIIYDNAPHINSGISGVNSAINPIISESLAPTLGNSVNPVQVVLYVASLVWLCGIAAMLIYATVSYLRVRRSVRLSMPLRDNIMMCDGIGSPFILGIIRPKIYIPSGTDSADLDYILSHEKAHISRRDHWWKPIGFLLLSVYWFNPLLWVAYILLCRDIEMACDERVIKNSDADYKRAYSEALLKSSLKRRTIAACPLAFGEVSVKQRIKGVLNYKKPAFWVIVAAVVICIVAAVCLLTNPITNPFASDPEDPTYNGPIFSQGKDPVEIPPSVAVEDKLNTAVYNAVAAHYNLSSVKSDLETAAISYFAVDLKTEGETENGLYKNATVYLAVMYREFTLNNLEYHSREPDGYSIHSPAVLSFTADENGYVLTDYWEPRDGEHYESDVKEKFPEGFELSTYEEANYTHCRNVARFHFCNELFYDNAIYDIDGDGFLDMCFIGGGPLSGFRSDEIFIKTGNGRFYSTIISGAYSEFGFHKTSTGELGFKITYYSYKGDDKISFLKVVFKGNSIELVDEQYESYIFNAISTEYRNSSDWITKTDMVPVFRFMLSNDRPYLQEIVDQNNDLEYNIGYMFPVEIGDSELWDAIDRADMEDELSLELKENSEKIWRTKKSYGSGWGFTDFFFFQKDGGFYLLRYADTRDKIEAVHKLCLNDSKYDLDGDGEEEFCHFVEYLPNMKKFSFYIPKIGTRYKVQSEQISVEFDHAIAKKDADGRLLLYLEIEEGMGEYIIYHVTREGGKIILTELQR